VLVNRTLSDIGALRDIVQSRCSKTTGGKFIKRCIEDASRRAAALANRTPTDPCDVGRLDLDFIRVI
jgi:hypothetical protein